jgi:hypothetical protein
MKQVKDHVPDLTGSGEATTGVVMSSILASMGSSSSSSGEIVSSDYIWISMR